MQQISNKFKIFFYILAFCSVIIILIFFNDKWQFKTYSLISNSYRNFSNNKNLLIDKEKEILESQDYNNINFKYIDTNISAADFSQKESSEIENYNNYEIVTNSQLNQNSFITTKQLYYNSQIGIDNNDIYERQNIIIKQTGYLKKRLHYYNNAINGIRLKLLNQRGFKEWSDVSLPKDLKVVWGNYENFLQRLVNADKNILNIILPWYYKFNQTFSELKEKNEFWRNWDSRRDYSNILINNYYTWTGDEQLCKWINNPGFTKAHWDAVYNRSCSININDSISPKSIEFVYFHSKPINIAHYYPNNGLYYPNYFYFQPPRSIIYVSIFSDAIVNLNGDVISGKVKAVPYTCSHDNIPTIPNEYHEVNIFSEIFVVTQYWGTSYFHFTLEVLPRIAPFLDFLLNNSNILIHAPSGDRGGRIAEFFEILGIKKERIVTGVLRAKILYLPHATPCGFALVHELQILSHHYRSFIKKSLSIKNRNRLILIKRSGLRRFIMHDNIESNLKLFSQQNGFLFTSFEDSPSPSLKRTMKLFNEAVIVVGPHGAGLANIIFAEPKTLVIEGVCNPPHVNMCYQRISYILGHLYHGISSIKGCESFIDITPERILNALNIYLPIVKNI